MTTTQDSTTKEQPWHASFPAPRTTEPQVVKREDLLAMFKSGNRRAGRDFLLVDVRRNDHEVSWMNPNPRHLPWIFFPLLTSYPYSQVPVLASHLFYLTLKLGVFLSPWLLMVISQGGTIHSSLNLPAQSLYHSLPTLYTLATSTGVPLVIFYCGSCGGRGPRAAGWFADYIEDQTATKPSDTSSTVQSAILQGGVKGWVAGGEEYIKYMDGFEKGVWEKTTTT